MPRLRGLYLSNERGRMWWGILFIVMGFAWSMSGVYMIVDSYYKSIHHTNKIVNEAKSSITHEIYLLKKQVSKLCEVNQGLGVTCDEQFDRIDKMSNQMGAHELEIKRLKEKARSH